VSLVWKVRVKGKGIPTKEKLIELGIEEGE